jgi:hypothetical protein
MHSRTQTLVDDAERWSLATHEAGHCVVATVLGHVVTSVELSETTGHTKTLWRSDRTQSHWTECVVALAGPMAEQRLQELSNAEVQELRDSAWKTDLANAERHLKQLDGHPSLVQAQRLAETLVSTIGVRSNGWHKR